MAEEADPTEGVEEIIRRVLSGVSTSFPATIIAPSAIEGLVDVQPNHKFKTAVDDTEIEPLPINNVVLVYPGRTQQVIERPPKESLIGSKVLVMACEHSLTEWRSSKGKSIYPSEGRQFDRNDAIAILGLYPETLKWPNAQKADTWEFLVKEGTKISIGSQSADLLNILYQFIDFFQTIAAGDGDTLAANLTAAQPLLLLNLKTLLAKITNV